MKQIKRGELKLLRAALSYDKNTGVFRWVRPEATCCKPGCIAGDAKGKVPKNGVMIRFRNKAYYAHRLAWEFTYGPLGNFQIDHINGINTDNRICNLRLSDYAINAQNRRKARKDNRLGLLGVSRWKEIFKAQIMVSGRRVYIGYFPTKEKAYEAYIRTKRQIHPGCTL
jgi:hypothetical protein